MMYNLNDEVEFTGIFEYDDWKIITIINRNNGTTAYTIFSQKAYENKEGHTGKWINNDIEKILGDDLNKTYGHWHVEPEEITLKNKSIISSYEDLKVGQSLSSEILNDWYEAGLNKYSNSRSKWFREGRNFSNSRTIESIKFHHGKMAMQVSGTSHDIWINIEGLSDFINKDNRIFPDLVIDEERQIIMLANASVTIQDLANVINNNDILSFSIYNKLKGNSSFQKATNIFDALGRITKEEKITTYEDLWVGLEVPFEIVNKWIKAGPNEYNREKNTWSKAEDFYNSDGKIKEIKKINNKVSFLLNNTYTGNLWINAEGFSEFAQNYSQYKLLTDCSSSSTAVSTIKGNCYPASFSNARTPVETEQIEKVNLIKTTPVKVTGYNYVTPKNK